MVDRPWLDECRCRARLLPGRGRSGAALLAIPRRVAGRPAAALVRPRSLRLRLPMPELSPKGFNKLSRTIGSGSAGPSGKARTPVFGTGYTTCREPGPAYAELQVTSNFSFLRGAAHPDELVVTAAALGHAAIAITDRNSFAGIVRAHHAAKTIGIRLVVGCRLDLRDGTSLLAFPVDRAAYG